MNNVFLGRSTLQSKNAYGERKYVFYNTGGGQKNSWRPTNGGVLQNPYKNGGKFFQGDLAEYTLDGKVTILKTYEVSAAVGATETTVKIVRDEFRHQPEVGDILMVAPSSLNGTGTAVKVTEIDDSNEEYWSLTIASALGAVAKGSILVEGSEAGESKKMMVSNPNSFLDIDAVNKFPTNNASDNVIYSIAPVMHEIAYIDRMATLPACVKAINKSLVAGLFEL